MTTVVPHAVDSFGSLGEKIVRLATQPNAEQEFLRLIQPGTADIVVSYRELVERAQRWRTLYERQGLVPSDRIIVILKHSLDLYSAFAGALLGGMIPAMFAFPSPKLSEQEYFRTVGLLITGTRARLVVCYDELAVKLEMHKTALGNAQIVRPTAIEKIGRAEGDVFRAAAPCSLDDIALVQFSSGTTGIKKGVPISHRALLGHVEDYARVIGLERRDRIASWLPLYHDMGLVTCFFIPLMMMVPLVAMSPFDWVRRPSSWLKAVSDNRATLGWLPNFAFSLMARSVPDTELADIDLSSLRGVVNCSEPLMAESIDHFATRFGPNGFKRAALAASYAMAENTFAVTSGGFPGPCAVDNLDASIFRTAGKAIKAKDGAPVLRTVSSGRALPGTTIRIVGKEGETLLDRTVGEIAVSSRALMRSYDNNPEATASSLIDGEFHTGDLGYMADGELYVTGRRKDLIIIGGRNFYPQDIEAVVGTVEGVIAGRVVAGSRSDIRLGTESIVILAETLATDDSRRADIERDIHQVVTQSVENAVDLVRLLPPRSLLKSTSGKLSRGANLERFLDAPDVSSASVAVSGNEAGASEGATRDRVRQAIREVVAQRPRWRNTPVDDTTSLIRSGLIDSFALAELLVALERALGRTIPTSLLADIENFETIDALVAALAGASTSATDPSTFDFTSDVVFQDNPPAPRRGRPGLWTLFYRVLLHLKGVKYGPDLEVKGPLILELDGDPRNIRIGRNVTLMPGVHLKIRESGKIILHDGAKLDTCVRLVAANNACIEIGAGAGIGMATILNAGRDILIGRHVMVAGHCIINASDHGMAAGRSMREQPFLHAPIHIHDDVWLGAHVFVSKGSRIGPGAIASAGSVVAGDIPPNAVVQGQPARIIKFRS